MVLTLTNRQSEVLQELCWERAETLKDRIKFLSSPGTPTWGPGTDDVRPYIQEAIDELNNLGLLLAAGGK